MAILMSVAVCLCLASFVHSSAIPMWEMLSRDEKMAYLYSHFLNQVEDFCEFSEMNNCNKELIKHGLGKLHSMADDHLDRMDPYQRGAQNIIWDSMMDGHESMKSKSVATTSTTARPTTKPSYPSTLYNLNKRVSSIQDQIRAAESFKGQQDPRNPNSYYIPDDIYTETNYLNTAASSRLEEILPVSNEFPEGPIVGPMVVRVKPDGTLVDKRLPVDEDLIHFKLSKTKVPAKHNLDKFIESLRPRSPYNSQPFAVYVNPRA